MNVRPLFMPMIITYYACQMAVTCTFQPAHGASTGALLNCQGPGGGVVTVGENINLNVAILLHL